MSCALVSKVLELSSVFRYPDAWKSPCSVLSLLWYPVFAESNFGAELGLHWEQSHCWYTGWTMGKSCPNQAWHLCWKNRTMFSSNPDLCLLRVNGSPPNSCLTMYNLFRQYQIPLKNTISRLRVCSLQWVSVLMAASLCAMKTRKVFCIPNMKTLHEKEFIFCHATLLSVRTYILSSHLYMCATTYLWILKLYIPDYSNSS